MRALVCAALLSLGLIACGGDSNDPGDVFPDAGGVYNALGGFDGFPTSAANFAGTLTLNQASQSSGDITGSAAYLVTIDGDVFNVNDNLTGAAVSPTGVVTYSLAAGSSTWTFTVTLSGTSLVNGRHTLTGGTSPISGAWTATRASASTALRGGSRSMTLDELARRLAH